MGISYKSACSALLAAGLAFGITSAQAASVNFTLTGVVDAAADVGNSFGLNFFDTVTAVGTFDDAALTGGTGTISFGSGSGNSITVNFGTSTFVASDDSQYLSGYPQMTFNAGAFTGFDMGVLFGSFGSFDSLNTFFDAYDDSSNLVSGTWTTYETAPPVPVPAAAWLFGSGLLGLAGIARRKSAS